MLSPNSAKAKQLHTRISVLVLIASLLLSTAGCSDLDQNSLPDNQSIPTITEDDKNQQALAASVPSAEITGKQTDEASEPQTDVVPETQTDESPESQADESPKSQTDESPEPQTDETAESRADESQKTHAGESQKSQTDSSSTTKDNTSSGTSNKKTSGSSDKSSTGSQNNSSSETQSSSTSESTGTTTPESSTEAAASSDNSSGIGSGESNYNTYNNTDQQQTTDTYVLNKKSKKIHHPSCSSVPKIAPQNYGTSSESLETLLEQGYTCCGICWK